MDEKNVIFGLGSSGYRILLVWSILAVAVSDSIILALGIPFNVYEIEVSS